MILTCSIKRFALTFSALFIVATSIAQVTSGRIVFERRTNLKKRMGDNPRMKDMINDKNKIRKENFELLFNESGSVFKYIETDVPEEGFLKYMTQRNTVYQNLEGNEKMIIMDLWGSPAHLKDSIEAREWKITDNQRTFDGYLCRKAIWEMNDSTRIYAWFSPDLVPATGPEGFNGLPGTILGLATEDGSVVYFAKTVEVMEVKDTELDYSKIKGDVYNKEELKALLAEKMGRWLKPGDLEAMFAWF